MGLRFLIGWTRSGGFPSCLDELIVQPVGVMDQCGETLWTDVRLLAGQTEDKDGKVVFGAAAVEAGC